MAENSSKTGNTKILVRVKPGLRLGEGGATYMGGQVMSIDSGRYPAIADLVEKIGEEKADTRTSDMRAPRNAAIESPSQSQTQMPSPVLTRAPMTEPREAPARKQATGKRTARKTTSKKATGKKATKKKETKKRK